MPGKGVIMGIRLLLYVLGFGLLVAAMMIGGTLAAFIDATSALLVLGVTAVFAMAAHHPSKVCAALLAGLSQEPIDQVDAAQHARVLQTIRGVLIRSGIVAFLIGGVSMLVSLDDPATIGPAVAVALLSMLYAVILSELIVAPMKQAILNRTE